MKTTIAGYGTMGRWVERQFADVSQITIYDPPRGFGQPADLKSADIVFVTVPTPQLATGECDTSIVEEVVAMAEPRQAIVCHSTVAIGTTDRLIKTYNKPLVYVPEFAGESPDHPYRSMENRRFMLLGGYQPAISMVKAFIERVYRQGCRFYEVQPAVAEVVKYMENAFLGLKVGFCNEFWELCQAVGVNYEEVRELWLQDHRINPSHTIVTSERGYGGRCLPKDVAAVFSIGRQKGVHMELMEALQRANTRHRAGGLETDDGAGTTGV